MIRSEHLNTKKPHLIEQDVFVVNVHNAILQSALPLALGSSNLNTEYNIISKDYNSIAPITQSVL